ncbi:ABC transporter ATP-binding protein [Ktedonosporobacter rubrisoli]|uniref:ABC transporter ATP-binding protein n=1 Tax=Ktedonosporobacter rubrisoli TaxID=2509675 RepID=A0A4P6JUH6_KTERU|nr:ABC transporter ATP-binding protein [Ktedonosporobacter rubrisoli]QBD79287.1 ABC transporter ATP-binding protein [Ktedonosporobacter rubrisoli]
MATFPEQNSFSSARSVEQAPSGLTGSQEVAYAIVTHNLVRTFGQKVAVQNLNLAVRPGEFFGFLGPNGAGKSTTIKMMVGLLRPTSGSVQVGGVDVWKDSQQARALMGVLPEHLNLYERLSGREFITFAGHMYGVADSDVHKRTEELLQVLDLRNDADKLIVDYSVGMRKKVALAAAILHRPQVLFLDEPFEGIDPVSSRVVRDILHDLTRRGTTIFFSSHIMEVVERLCTRVGIINQGMLVAEGTLQELRERAQGEDKDATLEEIFLHAIGVQNENHNLSWLE